MSIEIMLRRDEQELQYDAVLRFVDVQELGARSEIVASQLDEVLRESYANKQFEGKTEQIMSLPTLGLLPVKHVLYAGVVQEEGGNSWRKSAAAAARALKNIKAKRVKVVLHDNLFSADATAESSSNVAQAVTEGIILALHTRQPIKKLPEDRYMLETVVISPEWESENDPAWYHKLRLEAAVARGQIIAEAVAYARDITNLPGNQLTPEQLALEAENIAQEHELDIEVIDEWEAAEQGMGGLLGVGQGSIHPPRMIVLHYNGDPNSEEVWGLVGKGITFDTGGISLKTASGMEEMISDMGGAAAVLGAIKAIAKLRFPVNAVVVIPAAENMPSDRALKPGDVLRTLSGYTVEVVNTDAEGRLVLADGLTVAIQRGATRLIDVATLTGAVMVALGYEATGAVTNDEQFLADVISASKRSGERVWPLPTYPEYKKLIKSDAADLKNSGGRYAGTITGGLFIGHFADNLPWVHLDIGGTAWLETARGWEPKGATGVMVRTLIELLAKV